jgi:hypothetical protein
MTKIKKLIFPVVLSGTVALSGCALNQMVKMAKDQQLTVTPAPLEVHGDTVRYEISALLPVKMLKKGKVYTLNTFYQYDGKEIELEPVTFKEEDFPNQASEQPRVAKTFAMPYQADLTNGNLLLQGVASNPANGKTKSTDKMEVAEGLITTSKLVKDVYFAAYAPHGYNTGEELVATNVEFYFDRGSAVLRTTEKTSERGRNLNAFIAEKNVTRTVTITGTHSPEGKERINKNLAKDRAAAIEKYYRENMRKYDYKKAADQIKFVTKPVVEDWTLFKEALKDYDKISAEEKTSILSIVNGSGSFEEKENRLSKIPSYSKVFNDLYPKLRVAKTEIFTVKEKKSEAEIAVLAKNIAEGKEAASKLSKEELYYAASITPSLKEREAIFKAATKAHPNWVSHNNLGATYMEMAVKAGSESEKGAYLQQAIAQFEISMKMQESAEVNNNLGVVYLLQGNNAKANQALKRADELKPVEANARGLNGVRGSLLIKSGKYDAALSALSGSEETAVNLFNKGLAQLLKKDYQNALVTLEEAANIAKDETKASAHYASAIASARLQKDEDVFMHIKKAITAESSLKEKALNDLEFRNYQNNESFRNALK